MHRSRKSTELEEQMFKGMFLWSVHPLSIQTLKTTQPNPPKVCHVSITTRVHVPTSHVELFTSISALIALPLLVRHLLTSNHSAAINRKKQTKINNLRYESWYPYPLFWHTSFSYQKRSPCSTNCGT